jgi:hypothetical protein
MPHVQEARKAGQDRRKAPRPIPPPPPPPTGPNPLHEGWAE